MTEKPVDELPKKKESRVEVDTVPIETDQGNPDEVYHNYDDDEFEEFPAHEDALNGPAIDEASDVNVWQDNWEDENVEQDFFKQLREELQSAGKRI